MFFVYILLVGGGVDEELGWRGYALPRLQQRYGALVASVILGLFWAGWHIPAWFTPGSGQDAISFPVFVVNVTAAAIILTWLYNSTGGSLPIVILAHTVFDLCTTGPWSRALFTLPPDQTRPGPVQPAHGRRADRGRRRRPRDRPAHAHLHGRTEVMEHGNTPGKSGRQISA